jgi:hypothetical protein
MKAPVHDLFMRYGKMALFTTTGRRTGPSRPLWYDPVRQAKSPYFSSRTAGTAYPKRRTPRTPLWGRTVPARFLRGRSRYGCGVLGPPAPAGRRQGGPRSKEENHDDEILACGREHPRREQCPGCRRDGGPGLCAWRWSVVDDSRRRRSTPTAWSSMASTAVPRPRPHP